MIYLCQGKNVQECQQVEDAEERNDSKVNLCHEPLLRSMWRADNIEVIVFECASCAREIRIVEVIRFVLDASFVVARHCGR